MNLGVSYITTDKKKKAVADFQTSPCSSKKDFCMIQYNFKYFHFLLFLCRKFLLCSSEYHLLSGFLFISELVAFSFVRLLPFFFFFFFKRAFRVY